MVDKVLDIWDDYKRYIILGAVGVLLVFLLVVVLTDNEGEEELTPTDEVMNAKDRAEELSHIFSELGSREITSNNGLIAYEVSLYVKEPFITNQELTNALEEYVELLKWKVNDDKAKRYLTGLDIKLYDREILYEQDLMVNGAAKYMLKEEDKKKRKKEDKYTEEEDLRWEHTITQKKEPNYEEDYQLFIDYRYLTEKTGVVPLSDEEFEFLLKILKYQAIAGGNYGNAVKTYLEWDLGAKDTGILGIIVQNEFEEFLKRHREIGGEMNYYTGTVVDRDRLVNEMAVENPRFLVFGLLGEIIDDKVEAKKRLIEIDRERYIDIYVEDAKKQLAEGNFDTTSQEAVSGTSGAEWSDSDDDSGSAIDDIKDIQDMLDEDIENIEDIYSGEGDSSGIVDYDEE